MPTYEYRCAKCGEELEVFQTFAETPLTKHKGCGGKLAKVLSPAGIVLKGSGFYKTDNRSSSKRAGSGSDAELGVAELGIGLVERVEELRVVGLGRLQDRRLELGLGLERLGLGRLGIGRLGLGQLGLDSKKPAAKSA